MNVTIIVIYHMLYGLPLTTNFEGHQAGARIVRELCCISQQPEECDTILISWTARGDNSFYDTYFRHLINPSQVIA